MEPKEKACTNCRKVKPFAEFYRQKQGLYGRCSQCKKCRYELFDKTKGVRFEQVCRRCGNLTVHNRKRFCMKCDVKRSKLWKQLNPVLARKQQTKWLRLHPEYARLAQLRRYSWLRAGDVTAAQLRDLMLRSKRRCKYCGRRIHNPSCTPSRPRGFDHVTARKDGGKHTITNMVVCCWTCNTAKAAKENSHGNA